MAYGDIDPATGEATNPITSFILPPPQKYPPTNAQMQMRRNVALAMMNAHAKSPYPKTVGEGLTSLGQNIADIAYMRQLDAADQIKARQQQQNREEEDKMSDLAPAQGGTPQAKLAMLDDNQNEDDQIPTNAQPTSFFPTAEGGPQANPTSQAASVSTEDAGGPDQRLALNTYTDPQKSITDIAPAPAVPSSIAKMPTPVQVAQSATAPPEYPELNIPTSEPKAPPPPVETPAMRKLRRFYMDTDDPQEQAGYKLHYEALKQAQDRAYSAAYADWQQKHEVWQKGAQTREQYGQTRIPVPQAPGAEVPQNILNTPQSPQRSGRPSVPPMPASGVSQAEWSKFVSDQGQAAYTAYQKASPTFSRGLDLMNQVRNSPYLDSALALSGETLGKVPSPVRDVRLAIDQLKAMNFLQGYQDLRGGGQISNIEGDKATAAKAQLDAAQTPEAFRHALNNLEQYYREDYATIQRRMNLPVTAYKLNRDEREAPDIGTIVNGRVYEGGNPHDPNNWRKVR